MPGDDTGNGNILVQVVPSKRVAIDLNPNVSQQGIRGVLQAAEPACWEGFFFADDFSISLSR